MKPQSKKPTPKCQKAKCLEMLRKEKMKKMDKKEQNATSQIQGKTERKISPRESAGVFDQCQVRNKRMERNGK